jgi:ketosteroid isomerase-like protein
MNTNESQLRKIVEDWAVAVQNRDLKGAVAKHADDIVMFDVPFPLQLKGLDKYEKTWKLFFDSNPNGQELFNILELHIQADEHIGFSFGLIKIFDSTARLTMGFRKIEGQWQIIHEHHSYPIQ